MLPRILSIIGIDANLVRLGFGGLSGYYWSSTEAADFPQSNVWNEHFAPANVGSYQNYAYGKDYNGPTPVGVRCSRALTF